MLMCTYLHCWHVTRRVDANRLHERWGRRVSDTMNGNSYPFLGYASSVDLNLNSLAVSDTALIRAVACHICMCMCVFGGTHICTMISIYDMLSPKCYENII